MSLTAQIKFTQGLLTAPAGTALIGRVDEEVLCENGDNTGVTSWTWELVSVPIESSLVPGILSVTSTVTFTPDAVYGYLIKLTVSDGFNTVADERVLGIADDKGWLLPAYNPNPFGRTDAHNFTGQIRGWAGPEVMTGPDGEVLLLDGILKSIATGSLPEGHEVGDVPLFTGTVYVAEQLTEDYIQPAFTVGITASVPLVEVGQVVVTPGFTGAYTPGPPTLPSESLTLTDNYGSAPKNVKGSPYAFTSNESFHRATYGGSVIFTLTGVKGVTIPITRQDTCSVTWVQKVYWGVSVVPGVYDQAFIKGLATGLITTTRNRSFTVTAGENEYIYYAYRKAYDAGGDPSFWIGGFEGGFDKIGDISVTNNYGFAELYTLWKSTQGWLGLTTVTVS